MRNAAQVERTNRPRLGGTELSRKVVRAVQNPEMLVFTGTLSLDPHENHQ
jgi:hypothetical protein